MQLDMKCLFRISFFLESVNIVLQISLFYELTIFIKSWRN